MTALPRGVTLSSTGAHSSYYVLYRGKRVGLLTKITPNGGPNPWVGRPITEGTLGERLRGASRSAVVDLLIEWAERVGPPTGPQQPKVDPPAVRRRDQITVDAARAAERRRPRPPQRVLNERVAAPPRVDLGVFRSETRWINQTASRLRGHEFLPAKIADTIPPLYSTESTPLAKKVAVVHFFAPVFDWYVVEADPVTGIAFGWVENLSDPHSSELGYFGLDELRDLLVVAHGIPLIVERDLSWTPSVIPTLKEKTR